MKNIRNLTLASLATLALFASHGAQAAVDVFACEPEWGALASEIGGDKVSVFTATTARQDPHQIQARPALIARLRAADLVVCTGAELEIGWMPVLLRQASNQKVQPGSPGNFVAADQVALLDVPARLDRADGDVHAAGNPHFQTDPRAIAAVGAALSKRLGELDAGNAAYYTGRQKAFADKWTSAMQAWQAKAAPLRGTAIVVNHKDWVYLEDWLGLKVVATIEPKPGVAPGAAYLAQLLQDVPARNAKLVIYAAYEEPRAPQFVSDKAGIAAVMLPFTVGGTDQAKDLFSLFDDTIDRLLAGLGTRS